MTDPNITKEKRTCKNPACQKEYEAEVINLLQAKFIRGDGFCPECAKKEYEKAEAKRKRDAEAAEQNRLKEQQKFAELAEKRAARIAELEPLEEQVKRYEGAIAKQLEAASANVPDHIKALLDKLDPVEQLTYLAENAEALGKQSKGVDIDAGKAGKSKGRGAELTEDDIQLWCAKYNLDAKNITKEDREQIALAIGR